MDVDFKRQGVAYGLWPSTLTKEVPVKPLLELKAKAASGTVDDLGNLRRSGIPWPIIGQYWMSASMNKIELFPVHVMHMRQRCMQACRGTLSADTVMLYFLLFAFTSAHLKGIHAFKARTGLQPFQGTLIWFQEALVASLCMPRCCRAAQKTPHPYSTRGSGSPSNDQ